MRLGRREVLRALAAAPLAQAARAEATDYGSAAEVFDALDRLEGGVGARLRAIAAALPSARAFAASLLGDHERHRRERARLRRRLGLPGPAAPAEPAADRDLGALRSAQEALVYAHAEGLPALGDAVAVETLATHMVTLARHLTVLDLWLEAEAERG